MPIKFNLKRPEIMNRISFLPRLFVFCGVATAFLGLTLTSCAGLRIPYTPDRYTLHLWHLDEAGGNIATDAVAFNGIELINGSLRDFTQPFSTNESLGNL